jgi:large subunit ribosomal protein L21
MIVDHIPHVVVGDQIYLDKVLMIGTKEFTAVGTPLLAEASVLARVESQTRSEKITIFKKLRRKNSQKTKSHRQEITVMVVNDIFMQKPPQ